MSSKEVAIRVENLGKCYQIYDRPQDRLKQSIVPRIKRFLGHSTPNYYREFWALRDLSFEVYKGETVGIIGRNGSGKSTLLQIICGTLTPTHGTVQTSGRVAALLELGAGFNPEFTGRENVYLNGSVLGLSQAEIDERFDAIAAFADIGDFIEQPVKTYSSGMYVRLAFAVIAHVDADVLIIDEALAVGDAFFTQKCMRYLRSFMEKGTVLFVSHDTAAVKNLCSRAIWLEQGVCKFIGSAKDATTGYLEAVFEAQQGLNAIDLNPTSELSLKDSAEPRDMRLDFINCTQFRNDIELYRFDPDAPSFGNGGGRIVSVALFDDLGHPLSWVVGGENVILKIHCVSVADIDSPVIGFVVKDRLGQYLFGDNTYFTYVDHPIHVSADEQLTAVFEFRMPTFPIGDYSITVALSQGAQHSLIHHHWIHDALIFKSHASCFSQGLVGIPIKKIEMTKT